MVASWVTGTQVLPTARPVLPQPGDGRWHGATGLPAACAAAAARLSAPSGHDAASRHGLGLWAVDQLVNQAMESPWLHIMHRQSLIFINGCEFCFARPTRPGRAEPAQTKGVVAARAVPRPGHLGIRGSQLPGLRLAPGQ